MLSSVVLTAAYVCVGVRIGDKIGDIASKKVREIYNKAKENKNK